MLCVQLIVSLFDSFLVPHFLLLAAYLWFIVRRWRHHRVEVALLCDRIREYLKSQHYYDQNSGNTRCNPIAIAHLCADMDAPSPSIWNEVIATINKDARIEKSKTRGTGMTTRDSWMWTAPIDRETINHQQQMTFAQ
jgi:hypothetical protein